MRKEIVSLQEMIRGIDDDGERSKRRRELNYKLLRFNMMRRVPLNLERFPEYRDRLSEKTGIL